MNPRSLFAACAALLFTAISVPAHEGVELGPNGGRLVPFGEKTPLHAEVTLRDGAFSVGLYDEDAKKELPATAAQELTVTERASGKKIPAEKKDGRWSVPKPAGKDFWLILQLRDGPGAKARTARLHYDETICSECGAQEWICRCGEKKDKKK